MSSIFLFTLSQGTSPKLPSLDPKKNLSKLKKIRIYHMYRAELHSTLYTDNTIILYAAGSELRGLY